MHQMRDDAFTDRRRLNLTQLKDQRSDNMAADRTVRVNVTLPERLLRRIDERAKNVCVPAPRCGEGSRGNDRGRSQTVGPVRLAI
jgi:hypothetical protein